MKCEVWGVTCDTCCHTPLFQLLLQAFSAHGTVTSCELNMRFGFVNMESKEQAAAAVAALDGQQIDGARVKVRRV